MEVKNDKIASLSSVIFKERDDLETDNAFKKRFVQISGKVGKFLRL